MILRALLVTLALAVAGVAAPAAAASFDCAKARAADEVAVCRTPALSELDAALGAYWFAYGRVPMLMGSSGVRRDDAEAFLRARAACGADTACLTRAYQARIATLRTSIDGAMTAIFHEQNDPGPPPEMTPLPPLVARIVTGWANDCQRLGGALPPGAQPRVMTADLDGDGIPDYVVDASPLRCSAAASLYCANNGCATAIAFSANHYFDATMVAGGDLRVVARGPVAVVVLAVDRSHCPAAVVGDGCEATVAWTAARPQIAYRRIAG